MRGLRAPHQGGATGLTDAFICDRCEEVNEGYGVQARVGEYKSKMAFSSSYNFTVNAELCDECYDELVSIAEEYMECDTDG